MPTSASPVVRADRPPSRTSRPGPLLRVHRRTRLSAHVSRADLGFLRSHAEQTACPGILEHPQRAIGSDLYVADSVTNVPPFRRFGAALSIEDNAVECLA